MQDALKAAELELIKLEEKCKDRLDKYSQLLRRLAEVDSEDVSSKVSFYTATLSRALGKNHPRNHLVPLPNESNNLLTASGSSATDGSSLDEEEPDVINQILDVSTALQINHLCTKCHFYRVFHPVWWGDERSWGL